MKALDRHKVFRFQNYMLYAIAFFIPLYPRIVPIFITVLGILSIFSIVKGYKKIDFGEVSVVMILLFALHLIGMLYTENLSRGLFDIEVKLSFIAFPIALIGFQFSRKIDYERVILMFIYGTIVASVYCFAQSSYKLLVLDLPYYHFITTRFSVTVHPSYFALYLIFSILAITKMEHSFSKHKSMSLMTKLIVMIFLSIMLVLTGSKTGFIMWLIVAVYITISYTRASKNKLIPVLSFVAMLSVIGVIFQIAPLLQSRIVNVLKVAQSDDLNPEAVESTAVRALVYSSALDVVKRQNWYGNGTGDFQDVLDREYNTKNYVQAADKHLNAHNLFLQTWISLGIPGVALVMGMFLLLFISALRSKDTVYLGFSLFFLIISMTESTFNVQAGVVFFSFFAVFFERKSRSNDESLEVNTV